MRNLSLPQGMPLPDSQATRQEKLCGEEPGGRGDVRQVPMNRHTMSQFTMAGPENMIRTEVLTTSPTLEFMSLWKCPSKLLFLLSMFVNRFAFSAQARLQLSVLIRRVPWLRTGWQWLTYGLTTRSTLLTPQKISQVKKRDLSSINNLWTP